MKQWTRVRQNMLRDKQNKRSVMREEGHRSEALHKTHTYRDRTRMPLFRKLPKSCQMICIYLHLKGIQLHLRRFCNPLIYS